MKAHLLLIPAAGLLLAQAAFADQKQSYDFSGFSELDVAAGVQVVYTPSETYSVVAEFQKGDPSDLKISQSGDRLSISRKMSSGWGDKLRVKVEVSGPALNAVDASSGSSLDASGVKADAFALKVSSGASVEVSGSCGSLAVRVSSGGSADARDLRCESVAASASSGGSADAYASQSAVSKTSSGGSVDIWGSPAERTANHSMSGGSTSFHN
ncbi:MAG TPA: DUF2807 domain-containing protein [Hyphomonas sp.]|nr:DUF2807 domain-containing protein [Hyphomonas sp.]MCB9961320.1 DUF2807 domain-containing protein [Hyphomonas sp.]MCB9971495.1 DUF2807 domain-containing protein [Hyphomonas sp.]HPE47040.1 DUF2807 domain-containing protein [Hyphomonas sp.]